MRFSVLVSIEMLIMSVMAVISRPLLRQFLSTIVAMVSGSHDFDVEPKISFLFSVFIDVKKREFWICTYGIFGTLSGNLEGIQLQFFKSDFTDVNSGKVGGGNLSRILF